MRTHRSRLFVLVLLLGVAATSRAAGIPDLTKTKTTLYSFTGGKDGGEPQGNLVVDSNGNLFGVTYRGGTPGTCDTIGCGTVYELLPPAAGATSWTHVVLARFVGGNDGAFPMAGLTPGAGGVLYGTTERGGGTGCGGYGCGTIFRLTPPPPGETKWARTRIWTFAETEGSRPAAELTLEADGTLLGTASQGGSKGHGIVFALHPPSNGATTWSLQALHEFGGLTNGGDPSGPVTLDPNGDLIGTTVYGGAAGAGIIYRLDAPHANVKDWLEEVLFEFPGVDGGGYPHAALLLDTSGTIYGTATNVAFTLTPPAQAGQVWSYTKLHSFLSFGDVNIALSGLVRVAYAGKTSFYGSAGYGGMARVGGLYQLVAPNPANPNWVEGIVYRFAGGADGANPVGALASGRNGILYGTTTFGGDKRGCDIGCGTVFTVN